MDKDDDQDIKLDKEGLDDSVVAEEQAQDRVKKLKGDLKQAEAKAKEYLDGWQRAQADFINLRKKDEEAKAVFTKFANESLMIELIPVLDSFDMAFSHNHQDLKPLYKQLFSVLEARGLQILEPIGKIFDPSSHQSIGIIETNNKEEDHKVLEVVQKGYILSGKIIRPAKVKIGEYSIKNKE